MGWYIDTQDSWIKCSLRLLFVCPKGKKKANFSILEICNFTETHVEILFVGRQGMKAGLLDNEWAVTSQSGF